MNSIDWDKSGEVLLTGGDDRIISLWNPHANSKKLYDFNSGHTGNIFGVRFLSAQDLMIASCSQDTTVRIHKLGPTGTRCCLILHAHLDHVNEIQIHPRNDRLLWTAGSDGSIRCFDLREGSSCGSW